MSTVNYYKRKEKLNQRSRAIRRIKENLLAFIGLFFLLFLPGIGGTIESHYYTTGEIIAAKNQTILIEDRSGNLWEMEKQNFAQGDKVKLLMFTNFTDRDRTDDEIIRIKRLTK